MVPDAQGCISHGALITLFAVRISTGNRMSGSYLAEGGSDAGACAGITDLRTNWNYNTQEVEFIARHLQEVVEHDADHGEVDECSNDLCVAQAEAHRCNDAD